MRKCGTTAQLPRTARTEKRVGRTDIVISNGKDRVGFLAQNPEVQGRTAAAAEAVSM